MSWFIITISAKIENTFAQKGKPALPFVTSPQEVTSKKARCLSGDPPEAGRRSTLPRPLFSTDVPSCAGLWPLLVGRYVSRHGAGIPMQSGCIVGLPAFSDALKAACAASASHHRASPMTRSSAKSAIAAKTPIRRLSPRSASCASKSSSCVPVTSASASWAWSLPG